MKRLIAFIFVLVTVLGFCSCSKETGEYVKSPSVLSSVTDGYQVSDKWTVEPEFVQTIQVGETISALVTKTDKESITMEITDAGKTSFQVGSNYTISVSDNLPALSKGDYIRVVCNPAAIITKTEIPRIAVVFSVEKTDKTGSSAAD